MAMAYSTPTCTLTFSKFLATSQGHSVLPITVTVYVSGKEEG
jgi:hypothetical protein